MGFVTLYRAKPACCTAPRGSQLAQKARHRYIDFVLNARLLISAAVLVLTAACGQGTSMPTRAPSLSQTLTGTAEALEYETVPVRQELFREAARSSLQQAGQEASGPVLFPMLSEGRFFAAPGLDTRVDLLQAPFADAGAGLQLAFSTRGDRWMEDRRDSFQGLSEREAAELVARSLLFHWKISPTTPVVVDRAAGAPYAAAYLDGVLRINPAFVYLASAQAAQ